MIQVYKKNELFTIENTVTDVIYPNLTREEALVLLKKFDRNDTEHRCDFAIKEDNMCFEYVSLDDKDKTIADLEAKLAESETLSQRLQSVIDNLRNKSFAGSTLVDAINNVYEPIYKVKFDECEELKQQLAEKENTITNLIEDSNASKELLKKQLVEKEKALEIAEMDLRARTFEAECNAAIITRMRKDKDKDKISFAVEQLEKVKAALNELFENEHGCYVIIDTLDNQIEELKKEME